MNVSDQLHIPLLLTHPHTPAVQATATLSIGCWMVVTLQRETTFTCATTLSIVQLSQYTNYCSSSYGPFTSGPAFSELPMNHSSHMVLIGHILKKDNNNYSMLHQSYVYILSPGCTTQTPNSLLLIDNTFKTFCKSI